MPLIVQIAKAPAVELPHGRGTKISLFDPTNGVNNVDVHINILNPRITKGSIHYHKAVENIYVVLEGQGKIVDKNNQEYRIEAGQAVFFKPGDADTHELYNTGKGPLRLIEIFAPPHPRDSYLGHPQDRSKRDMVIVRTTE
jgi:mannose-6-phosphate isomerase-like protein (cupin superfamily)